MQFRGGQVIWLTAPILHRALAAIRWALQPERLAGGVVEVGRLYQALLQVVQQAGVRRTLEKPFPNAAVYR